MHIPTPENLNHAELSEEAEELLALILVQMRKGQGGHFFVNFRSRRFSHSAHDQVQALLRRRRWNVREHRGETPAGKLGGAAPIVGLFVSPRMRWSRPPPETREEYCARVGAEAFSKIDYSKGFTG